MKLLWLVVLLLLSFGVSHAQDATIVQAQNEEVQLLIRRYMQCQADNVGNYNVQSRLFIEQQQQTAAELRKVKVELEQERKKHAEKESN